MNRQQISVPVTEKKLLLLHEVSAYKEALDLASKLRACDYGVQVTSKKFVESSMGNMNEFTNLIQSRQVTEVLFISKSGLEKLDFNEKKLVNCTVDEIIGA
jgi:hypothetical protein